MAIDKNSEAYKGIAQRGDPGWVKITHFTEPPYNFDIKGVIHVGANDGYEAELYHKMGIEYIMLFEPLDSAFEKLDQNKFVCFNLALGDQTREAELRVTPGDGKGSTFLLPREDEPFDRFLPSQIYRFDHLMAVTHLDTSNYNCLVIDVQGMEFEVLLGFCEYLDSIDFINVECSEEPIYLGEAPAWEVNVFLNRRGFQRISPITAHDDVLYVRKALLGS